ncbi:MAG: hypothetical protein ACLFUR_05225 [Candidatus Hadarchaeia archaeon]
MRKKVDYTAIMVGVLAIALRFILGIFTTDLPQPLTQFLWMWGVAMVSLGVFDFLFKNNEVEKSDEMQQKSQNKAKSVSWIITFLTLLALGTLSRFTDLNVGIFFLTLLGIMLASYTLALFYFRRHTEKI